MKNTIDNLDGALAGHGEYIKGKSKVQNMTDKFMNKIH